MAHLEYGSYNLDLEHNQLFSEAYLAKNSNKAASNTNLPTLFKGIVEGNLRHEFLFWTL